MSQSQFESQSDNSQNHTENEVVIETEEEIQDILDILEDTDCRNILDKTSEKALSANEIAETLDLPLSTTYRKIRSLSEIGLLEEEFRIGQTGRHTSEYSNKVNEIALSTDDCIKLTVTTHSSSSQVFDHPP
ncbi:MAG: helix-turn-helix domain-containing protein [Halobacteriaceae archaeon]